LFLKVHRSQINRQTLVVR